MSLLTSSALPSLQLSNKLMFCASTRAPSAVIANLFKLKSLRPITPDTVELPWCSQFQVTITQLEKNKLTTFSPPLTILWQPALLIERKTKRAATQSKLLSREHKISTNMAMQLGQWILLNTHLNSSFSSLLHNVHCK